jgi:hypothetical protein
MMKRQSCGIRVLAVVLAALALSGPAAAGAEKPFKGRSSGVVREMGFDPLTVTVYTRLEGEGQATHLGRFTVTADIAIVIGAGVHGTGTLTAANGDQLFLTMEGDGIDPIHGLGEFTVVGGTGRFEGASGFYEQLITFAAPGGTSPVIPYTDVLWGWISY